MNDILEKTVCPGERELRDFAADPLDERWVDVASHVFVCNRCQDALAATLSEDGGAEPTPEDDAFIREFTARHCRRIGADIGRIEEYAERMRMLFVQANGAYALAAAPAACGAEARATETAHSPGEEVRFVYAAEATAGPSGFWRAELVVPPSASPETMICVSVSGAESRPVSGGILRIAGCALPISNGSASLPFSLFLDGLTDTDVSLARSGASPVSGRLLFF